jgi:hypothetical protein
MYSSMVTVDLGMIGVERAEKNEKNKHQGWDGRRKTATIVFICFLRSIVISNLVMERVDNLNH